MSFELIRTHDISSVLTGDAYNIAVVGKYLYVDDWPTTLNKFDRDGNLIRTFDLSSLIPKFWTHFVNDRNIYLYESAGYDIHVLSHDPAILRIHNVGFTMGDGKVYYADNKYIYMLRSTTNLIYVFDYDGNIVQTFSLSEVNASGPGIVLTDKYIWLNRVSPAGILQYSRDGTLIKIHNADATYTATGLAYDGTNWYAINTANGLILVMRGP